MIASTTGGKVQGLEKDSVLRFRGIPYAAPPVGAARFRPPQPVEPWADVRDATAFGRIAPQALGTVEAMLGATLPPQDEDCLTLNVVTPGCDDGARPVMVWIHGGAFLTGSGSTPWYSGTQLAARNDVVVVSINYRLGALGFSHLAALGEEFGGSGNCGILDQIAALEWVRDNITAFGGDPANVTIFGESAGGMSVSALLGTPSAAGLFHRAIAQSGSCHYVSQPDVAARIANGVAAALGSTDLSIVLAAPVDALLLAQQKVGLEYLGEAGLRLPFQPVVDGVVLPRPPLEAVAGGSAAGVDLITGTTAQEFTLFALMEGEIDDARLRQRTARAVGEANVDALLDAYRVATPNASARDLYVDLGTDLAFRIPAQRLLEAHAPTRPGGSRAYWFTYESTAFDGRLRSCHALDIPFTFDVVDHPGSALFLGAHTPEASRLATGMRTAWTSFARTGTPVGDGLPEWPAWDAERRPTMELGVDRVVHDDPQSETRRAWDGLL